LIALAKNVEGVLQSGCQVLGNDIRREENVAIIGHWSAPARRSRREHTYLSATGAYREDPQPAMAQNLRQRFSRRKPYKDDTVDYEFEVKFHARLTLTIRWSLPPPWLT
jgi:hypothetical protein